MLGGDTLVAYYRVFTEFLAVEWRCPGRRGGRRVLPGKPVPQRTGRLEADSTRGSNVEYCAFSRRSRTHHGTPRAVGLNPTFCSNVAKLVM